MKSCLVALVLAAALQAAPISASGTGLASPAYTITFSEVTLAQYTPVTNQFAAYGASFGPNIFYDPQLGYFPTPALGNFPCGDYCAPFSIYFTVPQTAAAFQFITNAGTSAFTAKRLGVDVETFSSPTDPTILYYGFTGITFDEIYVSPGGYNNAMLMDNLQLGSAAIPEPSSLSFLALGGLAFWWLRRQDVARSASR